MLPSRFPRRPLNSFVELDRRRFQPFPSFPGPGGLLPRSLLRDFGARQQEKVTGERVFNLEFSRDGAILGVACEDRSVRLLDGWNARVIASVDQAHSNCVNVIKFLNDYHFVTGSDDNTMALWDLRNPQNKMKTFEGHTSWIKNCEVSGGSLVSFGLDSTVRKWDIQEYLPTRGHVVEAQPLLPDEVRNSILLGGLEIMRIGIPPDGSKLAVALQNGSLFLVHDLDLETFASDMEDLDFNELLIIAVNKVFLSNEPGKQENLEEEETNADEEDEGTSKPFSFLNLSRELHPNEPPVNFEEALFGQGMQRELEVFTRRKNRIEFILQDHLQPGVVMSIFFDRNSEFMLTRRYCAQAEETLVYDLRQLNSDSLKRVNEFTTSFLQCRGELPPAVLPMPPTAAVEIAGGFDRLMEYCNVQETYPEFTEQGDFESIANKRYFEGIFRRQRVHIDESNFSSGFFKSSCFSNCGRFVCSPYHRGVRIFDVEEMRLGLPMNTSLWRPIINTHRDDVLVTAFSPTLPVMASGGLDGVVCFYSTTGI